MFQILSEYIVTIILYSVVHRYIYHRNLYYLVFYFILFFRIKVHSFHTVEVLVRCHLSPI